MDTETLVAVSDSARRSSAAWALQWRLDGDTGVGVCGGMGGGSSEGKHGGREGKGREGKGREGKGGCRFGWVKQ